MVFGQTLAGLGGGLEAWHMYEKGSEFQRVVSERPSSAVTSVDPNAKFGAPGSASEQWIAGEEPLRYSIFFENKDTATAPAQEVIISDPINTTNMDLNTLSLGLIAFGDKLLTPPPGSRQFSTEVDLRPNQNLLARINASLLPQGVLKWQFTSIDPATGQPTTDPLAGFLPPGVGGSILFTVMPKSGRATGTEIRNKTTIVFDNNAPIDTLEWLNTLDNDKPDSQVQPLAATQTTASFPVRWSGTDVGAGIKDYTVFFSENNGPFTPWLTNTTATSDTFTGQAGKTYGFYSVARDQTGNLEVVPAVADVVTQVVNQPPVAKCRNVTVVANNLCQATADINDGSYDPEGGALTLNQSPAGPYGLGNTLVTLTATDAQGASSSCPATVTVTDNTPPTIASVSASPSSLWPPNHKMVSVKVTATASDNCTAAPVCKISSVASNEPINGTGDGDTAPDWEITGALTANLRAERAGNGTGRVYTLTIRCMDMAGNSATKDVTVTVPHDQGK